MLIEIQRLRGIAILLVMIAHFKQVAIHLPIFLKGSWVGVDLFFVISGYVVTLSFLKDLSFLGRLNDRGNYTLIVLSFFTKRFFRIYPLVILAMGFHLGLTCLFYDQGFLGEPLGILKEDLMFFMLVFNYWRDNHSIQGYLWSLSVEQHFYLLSPLIHFTKSINSRIWLVVLLTCLFSFILRPALHSPAWANEESFLIYTTHRRLDGILLGVIAAYFFMGKTKYKKSNRLASLSIYAKSFIGLALIFMLWIAPFFVNSNNQLGLGFFIYALISCSLVVLGALSLDFIYFGSLTNKFLLDLGEKSFCIYLIHVPLVRLANHFIAKIAWTNNVLLDSLLFATFVILNLVFASFIYKFYERPFNEFGKKIAGRFLNNLVQKSA